MPCLLWCVASHHTARRPFSPVIVVGAVAAAATTGALFAIGRRMGAAGLPFAAIAAGLFHETARTSWPLTVVGVGLHVAITMLWSAVAVWCHRALGWRAVSAAFAVAVGAHLVSWVLAWSSGQGVASVLALGDRIELAVVFAIALVAGIRIAFLAPRST